jgi:hypothetical protein
MRKTIHDGRLYHIFKHFEFLHEYLIDSEQRARAHNANTHTEV